MERARVYPAQSVFGTPVTLQRSPTLALLERAGMRLALIGNRVGLLRHIKPAFKRCSPGSNTTAANVAAIGSRQLDLCQNKPLTMHGGTLPRAHLDPRCASPCSHDGANSPSRMPQIYLPSMYRGDLCGRCAASRIFAGARSRRPWVPDVAFSSRQAAGRYSARLFSSNHRVASVFSAP